MRFLNAIEAEVPAGKMVHVILDNYAAQASKVRAWLDRHERFVFHFTRTLMLLVQCGRWLLR
jgi:hypothetical protein